MIPLVAVECECDGGISDGGICPTCSGHGWYWVAASSNWTELHERWELIRHAPLN